MSKIVCPWCQNEIWLEPEETLEFCPVCENELGSYRTLEITLDLDPDAEAAAGAGPESDSGNAAGSESGGAGRATDRPLGEAAGKTSPSGRPADAGQTDKPGQAADRSPRFDEDLRVIGGEDMLRFRSVVDKLLETQLSVPECPSCREYMVEGGRLEIGPERFRPHVPPQGGNPVLEAPFAATVYLCPSCFSVHFILSDEDRMAVVRRSIGDDRQDESSGD